jgi:hypothetical protein
VSTPDPRQRPTMPVPEAGATFFGFGRAKSYAEALRYERTGGAEGLPVVRFGRSLRAITAACVRLVELDDRPAGGSNSRVSSDAIRPDQVSIPTRPRSVDAMCSADPRQRPGAHADDRRGVR